MVVQTAAEAMSNANATKTCSVGMCLWQTQEWLESPHMYPDASSQWRSAKYKHAGDRNPPEGAPVFWTGGGSGYGHATVSMGGGMVRSTDQQSNGKVATVSIDEIDRDWSNLDYAGWTEDIANVDLPYLRGGGKPTNPNGVKVGDLVYAVASGSLNGRDEPSGDGDVVTSKAYGEQFVVAALTDGWAQEQTAASSSVKTSAKASEPLVPVYDTDYLLGWDVSSNNSSSWVPKAEEDFGWVKATEGKSYVNPDYAAQLKKGRDAGNVVGHYHWLNDGDVTAQVNWFKSKADVKPGEMIAVDWEDSSNPTTAQKDDAINKLKAAYPDNKVGLYCNKDWWINKDTSSYYGDYLWIANYTSADDPGIKAEWLFWQFTSTPMDQNRGRFADLAALRAWAGSGESPPEPPDPVPGGAWYSTNYLFPMVKPDPTNAAGIKNGDRVEVTASGGLTARQLPGGPKSLDKNGDVLVRETGYQFDVTGNPSSGWITGGTNWYSSDYLKKVSSTPPTPSKPGWNATPYKVLSLNGVPGSVSYLQGVMHVEAVTEDDGTQHASMWIVAQDYDNKGDTRFLAFREDGSFINWFQVNDGGHAQTFYAYRSAAGNLYVWVGEDPAYRHAWQPGKKVSKTSGDKMDYKGSRPQGGYKDRIVFRNATDTQETFYLFDRTDFTDGSNRTKPIKQCTLTKDTSPTQQGWGANADRIYRMRGSTNEDTEHNHDGLHRLDVYDWSGKALLRDMDITDMHRSGCTEDEPEGISFSNPANGTGVLAAKREGSASASKRTYVLWQMTGMP